MKPKKHTKQQHTHLAMHDRKWLCCLVGSFKYGSLLQKNPTKETYILEENFLHSRELYGVATMSRLLKIISLFCRISSLLQDSFAKETYNFKEPTHLGHPICVSSADSGHVFHDSTVQRYHAKQKLCCNWCNYI